jgi:hypothetical protein
MKPLFMFALVLQLSGAPAFAQTLNESFDNSTTKPLTDKEQLEANNYVHTGRTQKILEAECKKLGQKFDTMMGCADESGKPGQVIKGGLGGMLEEILPKLYAVMGTVAAANGGAKIEMRGPETPAATAAPPATATHTSSAHSQTNVSAAGNTPTGQTTATETPAADAKNDSETNKKTDYCIYIPMGGEVIASGMQMMGQRAAQQAVAQNPADAQKESMYAVARTHDTRAKTSTIQGGIYAATAACYVAYVAKGAVLDWKMGLKIGAAGLMSVIFFKKAGNHKAYAKGIRDVANKLPGAGDCNPLTQTNCFCSEPTSQSSDFANFRKVCVVPELADRGGPNSTPAPCAQIKNGQASLDAACTCKRNNTCLNGTFASSMGTIGFGGVDIADPLRLLNETNGAFNEANVSALGAQLNAKSKRLLDTANISDIPSVALDERKKELAREINKLGMPARLAALTASQNNAALPASATGGGLSATDSEVASPSARRTGTGYNGGGSGSSSRRNREDATFKNPLAKDGKRDAVQVETFTEQAMASADITKDTSKGIFDIISNRYRSSAWSRFDMEKAMQEVPAPAAVGPAPATP